MKSQKVTVVARFIFVSSKTGRDAEDEVQNMMEHALARGLLLPGGSAKLESWEVVVEQGGKH